MEMMIILALAVGAMFLLTNRSRKQQREAANFRANLAPGQEVMTGSGLFGTVVAIDEENDVITLESTPGTETRWLRAAIAKVVEPPVAEETDEETDADTETTDGVEDARTEDAERKDAIDVPDDLSSLTDSATEDDRRDDGRESK